MIGGIHCLVIAPGYELIMKRKHVMSLLACADRPSGCSRLVH